VSLLTSASAELVGTDRRATQVTHNTRHTVTFSFLFPFSRSVYVQAEKPTKLYSKAKHHGGIAALLSELYYGPL